MLKTNPHTKYTVSTQEYFSVGDDVLILKGYRVGTVKSIEGELFWVDIPAEEMRMLFSIGEMAKLHKVETLEVPDAA